MVEIVTNFLFQNADVLIEKKTKNDKNAHLIHDSVDKLQNGIVSLFLKLEITTIFLYMFILWVDSTKSNNSITMWPHLLSET